MALEEVCQAQYTSVYSCICGNNDNANNDHEQIDRLAELITEVTGKLEKSEHGGFSFVDALQRSRPKGQQGKTNSVRWCLWCLKRGNNGPHVKMSLEMCAHNLKHEQQW